MESKSKWKRMLAVLGMVVGLGGAGAGRAAAQEAAPREIGITVEGGYKPGRIEVRAGERVRLKITRREYTPCTKDIVFPSLDIRRALPPNQAVILDLPSLSPGEYEFRCGMGMIRGTLVVLP